MSIVSPEIPMPPAAENKDASVETPPETPDVPQESEISNEQVEQYAAEAKSEVEQEAVGVVPEAESKIESSAASMNVSPETIQATRQEQGLDTQFGEIQSEADQITGEAKQEINSVMEREENPGGDDKQDLVSADERVRIIERIKQRRGDLGGEIQIPENPEQLIFSISSNPEFFDDGRVEETALANSEFAPKLTGYLAEKGENDKVIHILEAYADKPQFEYCVRELERTLPTATLDAYAKELEKQEVRQSKITEFAPEMMEKKATERNLEQYRERLALEEGDLENLRDKELLLVGGGNSPIKKDLSELGIDCRVVNIDPMAESGNSANADVVKKEDFFEVDIAEKFDESWALHSLPQYAFDRQQVKSFYLKSLGTLKDGGVARIAPIDRASDAFTPSMRLTRKGIAEESTRTIDAIKSRPDLFEVADFKVPSKSGLGRKTEIVGVKIKRIGNQEEVNRYLAENS